MSPVVLSSSESSSSTFDGLDESANAKEFSKHPLNRKMESLLRRFTGDHGPKAPTTTDRIAERMRAHHRRRLEHYIELRKRCRNGSGQSRPAALQFLDGIIEALGAWCCVMDELLVALADDKSWLTMLSIGARLCHLLRCNQSKDLAPDRMMLGPRIFQLRQHRHGSLMRK